MFDFHHRRYNPLTGEWLLVSPHRTKRPWLGQVERLPSEQRPAYDPKCYLCPGNERAGGARNARYDTTFVFTNDFAALLPDTPLVPDNQHPLLRAESRPGDARVICFSPRHDLTLAEMALPDIRRVVDLWADQMSDLGQKYRWVQIFENKGESMGCSNPHPHGQIWTGDSLPDLPAREDRNQRAYLAEHGRPLLLDYANLEVEQRQRLVVENEHWLALVPFWAVWPFETMLLPRRHVLRLPDLVDAERDALADVLKQLLVRYDNLFEIPFPYSMGWHGAPAGSDLKADQSHWQLHAHIFPPLLRSATIRKFMVGYELLSEPQRDITAEQAAARLLEMPVVHYKQRSE
jgi:UDPglucose--hexose-1-phosphate uridylyltransferase